MRKKEWKLIVTFHTTADAMAMERICKKHRVPGRLVPVPRILSAGCGLSWCTELKERSAIGEVLQQAGIEEEEMRECLV